MGFSVLHRLGKNAAAGLFTIIFVGCASAYVAPTGQGPSATISFEVDGVDPILGYVASFYYFEESDDRSCMSGLQQMAKINDGNPLAGKSTNTKDISVPTDRTIIIRSIFAPASAFGQRSCSADSFLLAEDGMSYLHRIKWLANQCDFDFYEITSGEEIPIKVKSEPSAC